MDERLNAILEGIGDAEFSAVAAGALGAERVTLVGTTDFVELTPAHFDRKTIGIVRASGRRRGDGAAVVDGRQNQRLSLAPNEGSVTHVEDEAIVYEQRFSPVTASVSAPRTATRYRVRHRRSECCGSKDLIDAKGTPFDVPTLRTIMRHLGEWNGHHAVRETMVTIPIQRDGFVARWNSTGFAVRLKELPDFADTPAWRVAFGDLPSSIVPEIYSSSIELSPRPRRCRMPSPSATWPPAMSFSRAARRSRSTGRASPSIPLALTPAVSPDLRSPGLGSRHCGGGA